MCIYLRSCTAFQHWKPKLVLQCLRHFSWGSLKIPLLNSTICSVANPTFPLNLFKEHCLPPFSCCYRPQLIKSHPKFIHSLNFTFQFLLTLSPSPFCTLLQEVFRDFLLVTLSPFPPAVGFWLGQPEFRKPSNKKIRPLEKDGRVEVPLSPLVACMIWGSVT